MRGLNRRQVKFILDSWAFQAFSTDSKSELRGWARFYAQSLLNDLFGKADYSVIRNSVSRKDLMRLPK